MRVSWNWLQDYIKVDLSIDKVCEILTSIGLEVEKYEMIGSSNPSLNGVIVGQVMSCNSHPNADKLKITKINIDNQNELQIICGAPNVAIGQKVFVATLGTKLSYADQEVLTIKKAKIRGEESFGMLCSEVELGIGTNNDGILILDQNIEVGTKASDLYKGNVDFAIEIGLTPNRSDAMSHKGIARDLHAALTFLNIPHQYNKNGMEFSKINTTNNEIPFDIKVTSSDCIAYRATILEIENNISPQWLIDRLFTIKEKSINAVVDCSNFILHDIGQPTHCFDVSKMGGNINLEIKNITKNYQFSSLNNDKIDIIDSDLVISNNDEPICLAGIIGGIGTSVDNNSKKILLETANFNSSTILKSTNRLNLKTESSSRFEKNVDPLFTDTANIRMLDLLGEITKAKLITKSFVYNKSEFQKIDVVLDINKLYSYAGINIPLNIIEQILTNLEIEIKSQDKNLFFLKVPLFKSDVTRQEDIIEEILRIYGYNNIPMPTHLKSNLIFDKKQNSFLIENKINTFLEGMGFNEIMTNTISNQTLNPGAVELLNSMTSELNCMRTNTKYSFLETAQYNLNRDQKNLKLFEIGNIYYKDQNKCFSQKKVLSLLITGHFLAPSWHYPKGLAANIFHLKDVVDSLINKFLPSEFIDFISKDNLCEFFIQNQKLGFFEEIDANLLKSQGIKQKVFFANIDLECLFKIIYSKKISFSKINKFPQVIRDLSMLISDKVSYSDIEKICIETLNDNLTNVVLFDQYINEKDPNRKSYAIRLTLEDKNQTFTDEFIDGRITELIDNLTTKLNAEIRKN